MIDKRRILKIDNVIRRKYLNGIERKLFVFGGLIVTLILALGSVGYSVIGDGEAFSLQLMYNSLQTGLALGLVAGMLLALGHNIFRQQIRTQFSNDHKYVNFERQALGNMKAKGTINKEEYEYFVNLREEVEGK